VRSGTSCWTQRATWARGTHLPFRCYICTRQNRHRDRDANFAYWRKIPSVSRPQFSIRGLRRDWRAGMLASPFDRIEGSLRYFRALSFTFLLLPSKTTILCIISGTSESCLARCPEANMWREGCLQPWERVHKHDRETSSDPVLRSWKQHIRQDASCCIVAHDPPTTSKVWEQSHAYHVNVVRPCVGILLYEHIHISIEWDMSIV